MKIRTDIFDFLVIALIIIAIIAGFKEAFLVSIISVILIILVFVFKTIQMMNRNKQRKPKSNKNA